MSAPANPKEKPQDPVVQHVTFIVMGNKHTQSYKASETLGDASLHAIKVTHQAPEDLSKWELKTDAGASLKFTDTFKSASVQDKAILRLTRASGTTA